MAASGAPALVAALRDGGAAAARAARQCQALCITSSGRAELSAAGAVAATVGLVSSSSSDSAVSTTACQLLNQLCSECPPNAAAAIAAGCLPALARLLDGEDRLAALEAYCALTKVLMRKARSRRPPGPRSTPRRQPASRTPPRGSWRGPATARATPASGRRCSCCRF
jgi:hypothetical protein